jgi:hypothetical protein
MTTKITSANIDTTSVATATSANTANFNIALLGFKMAITEGLTVFNLVDGIVDEFEDESGTDGSASTSLTYNSTDDYYVNSTSPTGVAFCTPSSYSAGFTTTTITEPDTSTAGTNPATGVGCYATFTVPAGMTSANVYLWGAGGRNPGDYTGGGGGFSTGTLALSPGQVMEIVVGEGGTGASNRTLGGGGPSACGISNQGGGASVALTNLEGFDAIEGCAAKAPQVFLVGAGGGGGGHQASPGGGGAGGGLTGDAGGQTTEQSSYSPGLEGGGGGSQSAGGQAAPGSVPSASGFLRGGSPSNNPQNHGGGSGGGGFYGGGGGGRASVGGGGGGGGSSYYGNPQVSSGSTEEGQGSQGGGISSPFYVAGTNEGTVSPTAGEDGYVLLVGCGAISTPASVTSSTIISDPFTANVVPTNSRIVVFEENVGSPTLNTDIIASVSRNGGTNFTTVTLSDSGYVTGASGQRILTGQASISGQPSGQSMKWKLQLANQTVKIHGVSLQWS